MISKRIGCCWERNEQILVGNSDQVQIPQRRIHMRVEIQSDLYSSSTNRFPSHMACRGTAETLVDISQPSDDTREVPSPNVEHPQVPEMAFNPRTNQLGHDLIVERNSTPGARISCLPLPLSTCFTTASATTYGSITAIPEPSILALCGAIMAVDDQVGWTHVSLISGALMLSLRSSAERPSWKARAEALVMQ